MKTHTGKQLQFISQIKRDGSGVIDLTSEDMSFLDREMFELLTLSLSDKTFMAFTFSVYVVKIKHNEKT